MKLCIFSLVQMPVVSADFFHAHSNFILSRLQLLPMFGRQVFHLQKVTIAGIIGDHDAQAFASGEYAAAIFHALRNVFNFFSPLSFLFRRFGRSFLINPPLLNLLQFAIIQGVKGKQYS